MPTAPDLNLEDDTDLLYEEDILRNGYSLKYWWRYMEAKQRAPAKQRNMIAERALKYLPGSYKVWHHYLKDRRQQVLHRRPEDPAIENLNRTYERALVTMHKMPRIWLDYLEFLLGQHRTTVTRQKFDRALRALPITQHEPIWKLYLQFAKECPVKETAVRVYRRYVQFEPEGAEEYVDFLLSIGRVGEAALKLAEVPGGGGGGRGRGRGRGGGGGGEGRGGGPPQKNRCKGLGFRHFRPEPCSRLVATAPLVVQNA